MWEHSERSEFDVLCGKAIQMHYGSAISKGNLKHTANSFHCVVNYVQLVQGVQFQKAAEEENALSGSEIVHACVELRLGSSFRIYWIKICWSLVCPGKYMETDNHSSGNSCLALTALSHSSSCICYIASEHGFVRARSAIIVPGLKLSGEKGFK